MAPIGTDEAPPPIAILGMGLRLPGSVSTPEDFWNLLINKKDSRCRVPGDRYNIDAFGGGKLRQGAVASDYGYFLDGVNLRAFDASFFSMNRTEVETLDPQQRLLLEVVWECMERAGQTNWQGTNIGCFVGVFGEDWHDLMHKDTQASNIFHISSSGDFAMSNRISYEYNLHGASMTIRTACSSSLTALHEACKAIYCGDCSAAIVAGSSLILSPSMTLFMSEQGVLSPTGFCKTFDAAADGFVRGEGVNAIFIKRLDDAVRNKDPIRAIIRSTAANCDGKTAGFALPSAESHEALIRQAYKVADINDLSQTCYVECHGTGTRIGDPIETRALANVFKEHGVYIGSVKPNVGHSEGASGITSLIKAILALEHQAIPPNIHFSSPNPKIPFEEGKLKVPLEVVPWPKDAHARVSINSYGIGGSNAHNGVSNGDEICRGKDNDHDPMWPRLLPISANNLESLRKRVQSIKEYVELHPGSIDGVAYTLGNRRDHMPCRTFCMASSHQSVSAFDGHQRSLQVPTLAFVFTGQGAQWSGMGRDLILGSPSFRQDIRNMDEVLQGLEETPSWTIEGMLMGGDVEILGKAEYSQPLCTAIQVALVNLLASRGVRPDMIIGHSSGEIAGAYASGALTTEEAIIISFYRGKVMARVGREGGMAAVGLPRDEVGAYLADGVQVACENSPKNVTLSGDLLALEETLGRIRRKNAGTFVRKLHVDMAYHSDHMHEIGKAYEELLVPHLSAKEAAVPFYSSVHVSGQRAASNAKSLFGPRYWRDNMELPVLFSPAVRAMLADTQQETVFVEVGPHSALRGPLSQIFEAFAGSSPQYVPTLRKGMVSTEAIIDSLGQLFVHGYPVDFSAINPPSEVLVDLPNYPWDHSVEYWNESRLSSGWRALKHPYHELLGYESVEASDIEPTWRNVLRPSSVPWLRDHNLADDVVFPCAGYIAMMGEALRQRTGSDSYSLRELVIRRPVVLKESDTVEMMTSMRAARLTDFDDSSWFELTISSWNGVTWFKNCVAQGRAGGHEHRPSRPQKTAPYPRLVPADFWYRQLRRLRINYGPRLQGLRSITAATDADMAAASVRIDEREQHSPHHYPAHPAAIDACLQLFTVALSRGVARHFRKLVLPTAIGHVSIRPGRSEIDARARTRAAANGRASGQVVALDGAGEAAISLDDVKMAPLDMGEGLPSEQLADAGVACLRWCPDIGFLDPGSLIRLGRSNRDFCLRMEELCAFGILRVLDTVAGLDAPDGHLAKFVAWLREERERMAKGEWALLVPEAQRWASSDAGTRESLSSASAQLLESSERGETLIVLRMMRRLSYPSVVRDVFTGKAHALQYMMDDDGWTHLYNVLMPAIDYRELLALSSHSRPALRVLEIGAGTGAMTQAMLDCLRTDEGTRTFSEYTFTDVSSGFFAAAKERFRDHESITYRVLDISASPANQGFDLGSFDFVVASNVIHATPSLGETLKNVRSLLRPGGHFLLHELIKPTQWRMMKFIMGFLPGWWLGENDGRPCEPYVSEERWKKELCQAGFSVDGSITLDDEMPYHMSGAMVATAIEPVAARADKVTLLYDGERHEFARTLAQRFHMQGLQVQWTSIRDWGSAPDHDVISTVELEGPYLHEMSQEDYTAFMAFVSRLEVATGVLWLTRPAQIACKDPCYGTVIGLARTIRSELTLDFATVELQSLDDAAADAVLAIWDKFGSRRQNTSRPFNPEAEYAVHDGRVHTGRYHWISMSDELDTIPDDGSTLRLTVERPGVIDSLRWAQHQPNTTAMREDEVEIEVRAVGVNFHDILSCMGRVEGEEDEIPGVEAAGVVARVGPSVDHLKVGDRVMTLSHNCFATRKVEVAKLVVPIPDDLSFEDASTMPAVYSTVIHCLIDIGRLAKGQSILIHSACGGVGLAALQICKMLEVVDIFATVGSEEKVQYLMENFGLPRERIFYSRSAAFQQDVMQATNARGVDVVLNSLAGELLVASWECVANHGKMIEIGRRDFLGRGRLPMGLFNGNRSFHGINMDGMCLELPEEIRMLMERCVEYYRQGHIKPIRPIQTYPAQRIAEAFRYMQQGVHMGKIVVTMPHEGGEQLSIARTRRQFPLSGESTYLLTGGLGGLGKALVTWMVEQGARNFVFLSPAAGGSGQGQAFLRELESQGCSATAVSGNVAELTDVKRAIEAAPSPIAGVLHLAMVLKDLPILQISHEDWESVQAPKIRGAWNLHEALGGADLDFFINFSSVAGVYGNPGQASYAAANTFLQSFAQHRRSLGLPCSVVDLGIMEGIGFISRDPSRVSQMHAMGAHLVQEQDLIDVVQLSIERSLIFKANARHADDASHASGAYCNPGQLVLGLKSSRPITDPGNRIWWRRDIRMGLYRQVERSGKTSQAGDGGLQSLLNSIDANPALLHEATSRQLITQAISRMLCGLMLKPEESVQGTTSLSSMGIDSLVSIEIRNWWRRTLGDDLSVLEITNADTVEGLGNMAIASLQKRHGSKQQELVGGGA